MEETKFKITSEFIKTVASSCVSERFSVYGKCVWK